MPGRKKKLVPHHVWVELSSAVRSGRCALACTKQIGPGGLVIDSGVIVIHYTNASGTFMIPVCLPDAEMIVREFTRLLAQAAEQATVQ